MTPKESLRGTLCKLSRREGGLNCGKGRPVGGGEWGPLKHKGMRCTKRKPIEGRGTCKQKRKG